MRVGSLFSGIGGFDLGLERAGMRTVWLCEQDPFCRRVLAKHWPDVPCYEDVRELDPRKVEAVDVLAGGWPCPGFSIVGRNEGFEHEGSGLWVEIVRLVRALRPRYLVLENVAALLGRGLGRVVGDLAEIRYDAEWDCLPASAFGAPHRRDRIWIVAYPDGLGRPWAGGARDGRGRSPHGGGEGGDSQAHEGRPLDDAGGGRHGAPHDALQAGRHGALGAGGWPPEPEVGRVVDGFPGRVDQVRALGNSLVPQVAEWIGRRIVEAEQAMSTENAA